MPMIAKCKYVIVSCYCCLLLLYTAMAGADESGILDVLSEADSSIELKYYRDQFDETPLESQYSYSDMLELRGKLSGFFGESSGFGIDAFARYNPNYSDQIISGFDELWLQTLSGYFEYTLGYQIIDMGSMEHKPIVDVLNNRDFQYDWLRPAKIGAPLLSFKVLGDYNNLGLYYAPYFIPNKVPEMRSGHYFPGMNSTNKSDVHEDQWAIRYTYLGDSFELGLSYMHLTQEYLFSRPYESLFRNRRLGIELTGLYKNILLRSEVVYQKPVGAESGGNTGLSVSSIHGQGEIVNVF